MSGLFGDWDKLDKFLSETPGKIKKASEVGGNRAGALLSKRIKEGLRSQSPGGKRLQPIQAWTAWTRKEGGGTKALIASGEMLRSVTWKRVKGGVWVGANRRDSSGKYNLAAIHEKGCTIEVTPKMRGRFHYEFGSHIKPSTKYIHIPARPFIGPVASDPDIQQELIEEYVKAIREVLRP